MRSWLLVAASLAVGAAAGFGGARLQDYRLSSAVPSNPIRASQLSCKSYAHAWIFEDLMSDNVVTTAGPGVDEAALKIGDKEVTFLVGAGIRMGITSGETYPILRQDAERLLAAKVEDPQGILHGFVVNKKTGRVIWTKLNGGLLPSGQVMHFHCY